MLQVCIYDCRTPSVPSHNKQSAFQCDHRLLKGWCHHLCHHVCELEFRCGSFFHLAQNAAWLHTSLSWRSVSCSDTPGQVCNRGFAIHHHQPGPQPPWISPKCAHAAARPILALERRSEQYEQHGCFPAAPVICKCRLPIAHPALPSSAVAHMHAAHASLPCCAHIWCLSSNSYAWQEPAALSHGACVDPPSMLLLTRIPRAKSHRLCSSRACWLATAQMPEDAYARRQVPAL